MPKPYDATGKFLVHEFLLEWLKFSPFPEGRKAEIIDADLSTITAEADKVLRVEEPSPWIFHLELQTHRDNTLPERVHWYNALLEYRHGLPVFSLVVLLQKEADCPGLTGALERALPDRAPYRWFRYEVLRVWRMPPHDLLSVGLGLAPLATLTDEAARDMLAVLEAIERKIDVEAPDSVVAATIWRAVDTFLQLRYERKEINQMLEKFFKLDEPSTSVRVAELKGMRAALLLLGTRKFGPLPEFARSAIYAVRDNETLADWLERLLDVTSWEELLAETPAK